MGWASMPSGTQENASLEDLNVQVGAKKSQLDFSG